MLWFGKISDIWQKSASAYAISEFSEYLYITNDIYIVKGEPTEENGTWNGTYDDYDHTVFAGYRNYTNQILTTIQRNNVICTMRPVVSLCNTWWWQINIQQFFIRTVTNSAPATTPADNAAWRPTVRHCCANWYVIHQQWIGLHAHMSLFSSTYNDKRKITSQIGVELQLQLMNIMNSHLLMG